MQPITFVTANPNKLAEAQAILKFPIVNKSVDLDEIQTLDMDAILIHKLHAAFKHIGGPVIVDDVSAELESLNGLPGPFIKFFEQKLGQDALYQISKAKNDRVKIICCMGYFDGQKQIVVRGILQGIIVPPRGDNGWGFDQVIIPDGYDKTMAEMPPAQKNKLSHRYVALTKLAQALEVSNIKI